MAAQWTRDGIVFTQNELKRMGVENPESLGFFILIDEIPEHNSYEVKMVKTGEILEGKVIYSEVPLTNEEKLEKLKECASKALMFVDMYIDIAICEIRGYDNRDAIGKYLVEGNPFYGECSSMSLWIANCYVKCREIENSVLSGTASVPKIEDLILALPIADFLTEEEKNKHILLWNQTLADNDNMFITQKVIRAW